MVAPDKLLGDPSRRLPESQDAYFRDGSVGNGRSADDTDDFTSHPRWRADMNKKKRLIEDRLKMTPAIDASKRLTPRTPAEVPTAFEILWSWAQGTLLLRKMISETLASKEPMVLARWRVYAIKTIELHEELRRECDQVTSEQEWSAWVEKLQHTYAMLALDLPDALDAVFRLSASPDNLQPPDHVSLYFVSEQWASISRCIFTTDVEDYVATCSLGESQDFAASTNSLSEMWELAFESGAEVRVCEEAGVVERWALKVWPWDLTDPSADARFDPLTASYPLRTMCDRAAAALGEHARRLAAGDAAVFIEFAKLNPNERCAPPPEFFVQEAAGDDDGYVHDPAAPLEHGSNVSLFGLKAKPELNGRFGRLSHEILDGPNQGRWAVNLTGMTAPVAIRPANIRPRD